MIEVLKLHIPDTHSLTAFCEHLRALSVRHNVIDNAVIYEHDTALAESIYTGGEEWLLYEPDVVLEYVTDYDREQLWQD